MNIIRVIAIVLGIISSSGAQLAFCHDVLSLCLPCSDNGIPINCNCTTNNKTEKFHCFGPHYNIFDARTGHSICPRKEVDFPHIYEGCLGSNKNSDSVNELLSREPKEGLVCEDVFINGCVVWKDKGRNFRCYCNATQIGMDFEKSSLSEHLNIYDPKSGILKCPPEQKLPALRGCSKDRTCDCIRKLESNFTTFEAYESKIISLAPTLAKHKLCSTSKPPKQETFKPLVELTPKLPPNPSSKLELAFSIKFINPLTISIFAFLYLLISLIVIAYIYKRPKMNKIYPHFEMKEIKVENDLSGEIREDIEGVWVENENYVTFESLSFGRAALNQKCCNLRYEEEEITIENDMYGAFV